MILAQSCTSNFLKPPMSYQDSINSKASSYVCPVGFANGFDQSSGNRTCLTTSQILSNLGKICTGTQTASTCGPTWLTCPTSTMRCTFRRTRMLGEYCTVRENCVGSYGTITAGTNCVNHRCVSMTVVANIKEEGKPCRGGAIDLDQNIMYDCATPGYECVADVCLKIVKNTEGGPCATAANNVRQECATGFGCYNDVCKAQTMLSKGQNCTAVPETTVCGTGLVCKKASSSATYKSCEVPSVYGEFCESASDCYKLPVLQMRCSKNKCIRRYSQFDGVDCESHQDCFSGYCQAGKCASPINLPCSTTQACPSGTDYKCGCGGATSASPFNGTCVPPCNGYQQDFLSCAYNNGLDELTTSYAISNQLHPVDSNSTLLTKACSREYKNLLKCYIKAWKDVGVYNGENLVPGVDLSGALEQPTYVVQPVVGRNISSPSPKTSAQISEGNSNRTGIFSMFLGLFLVMCIAFMNSSF
ncbi:hypothetical protein C9374_011865 [Naegleria lovaniensis]|uniref:Uncharacterized protein n=1 Tax=Naegleria lovaniensis TaxID=51637 RepID=A0AA88KF47_NAELO|nr:uncharacterized protein C9374_011865 [Naegleria lovaniensis]KAG2373776.1 hypothetical protein C9374_011865 [Naegleria lovaniensis]